MDEEKKSQIIAYIRNQQTLSEQRLKTLIVDDKGNKRPQRDTYHGIKRYMQEFLQGKSEPRWYGIAGIRGIGKTTLLLSSLRIWIRKVVGSSILLWIKQPA
jgi:predicted AAA+ superfamily ATPase